MTKTLKIAALAAAALFVSQLGAQAALSKDARALAQAAAFSIQHGGPLVQITSACSGGCSGS